MRVFAERSARSIVATAVGAWALAGASSALAQTAGTTTPVIPSTSVSAARTLADSGKLVEARSILTALAGDPNAPAETRARAAAAMAEVEKKIAAADANDIALQRAELALRAGDLKLAQRQAFAVATSSTASSQFKQQASALLKQAESAMGNAAMTAEQPADQPKPRPAPVDLPDMPKLPSKAADPYFPVQPTAPAQAPASQPAVPQAPAAAPIAAQPAPASAPAQPAEDFARLALKANAQALLVEGEQLYTEARYAEAIRKFEGALANRSYLSSDEIARAEQKLAEAKVRLGTAGGGTLDRQVEAQYRIVREKTSAEFENALTEADAAIKAGDASRARQQVETAGLVASRNRAYFSATEYEAMDKRVADMRRTVDTTAEANRVKAAQEREAAAAARTTQLQADMAAERTRQVEEGLKRVRILQKDRKYPEALDVVNDVLFKDPGNPTAELLRDVLLELRNFQLVKDKRKRTDEAYINMSIENADATRPPIGIIEYPDDWAAITQRRTGVGGFYESPENRRADASMGKVIPASFENIPLQNALAYVGRTAGVAVEPDWKSLQTIGVEPSTPVTLAIGEAPAKVVLDNLLKKVSKDRFNKADYAINDGIVAVGSADVIKQQTVTVTYPVSDMLLFSPDYAEVPVMDLESKIGPNADRKLATSDAFRADRRGQVTDKQDRVRQIVSVIQQSIDPDSWKENGGSVGSVAELNGLLVITNTPRNHKEITGLLSKLREIRQTQLSVEARFLLVDQDFFEQINFDLDVYFNANSSMVSGAQGLDPNIRPSDLFDPATGRLRRVLDSDQYAAGGSATPVIIPPGTATRALQNTPLANNWSPIGTTQNGDLARFLVPADSFTGQLLNQSPALGIAGQYLDDIQVDFLIKATQADRRTVTLTAPRLTFTNGQIANVVVGTQRAFVGDLEPVTGDGSVAFDPVPNTLTEGVTLLVEGVASADRRYITMNVETSIASLIRLETFTQQAAAAGGGGGGGGGGAAVATGTFQLPTLQVTRVETTVTVPDQGTIMLGGQRVTEEVELETGVPVLSKIPMLNRFFTNRVQSRKDRSLLILMKPTVLVQAEEEEKAFPGLLDSIRAGN